MAVTAALGVVINADVSVTCAPSGLVLGTGSTGAQGTVNVSTSGSCSGPVLVSVRGRSDGSSTYYDEALAATVALPAGTTLRALVPAYSGSLNLGVTALTEIATRRALSLAGNLAAVTAAQVSSTNGAIGALVLGSGATLDILVAPTPWSASTATGSLGNSAADRYALYLGALARMASAAAAPALAVMDALATDLADGTLGGGSSGGFSYTATTLAGQLASGLSAMAAYAGPDLRGALGLNPAVSGLAPASGAVGDTVTLTGSGFDADPFHLLVKFSNNLTAEVVSSSPTQVVVRVPAGAVNGPISVTHTLNGLTATSSTAFTVTAGGDGGAGSWTVRASPSGFLLNGLAYGNGLFVAVGFGKTLLTSSDGLSWTTGTAPDNNYYDTKAVRWTGTQFVMVGDKNFGSSAPPLIATSPDGQTWTRRTWAPGSDFETLVDVAAGLGKLTVVGLNGTIASSSDAGATWTTEAATVASAFQGVAGNDSARVAVGRDGSFTGMVLVDRGNGWQWQQSLSNVYMRGIAWTTHGFVAVGSAGASNSGVGVVLTSPDGVTWTRREVPADVVPEGYGLLRVAEAGTTLYATGDNASNQHLIIRSTDGGATWTRVHQGTTNGNAVLAGIASSPVRVVTVGGVKSVTLP